MTYSNFKFKNISRLGLMWTTTDLDRKKMEAYSKAENYVLYDIFIWQNRNKRKDAQGTLRRRTYGF